MDDVDFKPVYIFDGLLRKSIGKLKKVDFGLSTNQEDRLLPADFEYPEDAKGNSNAAEVIGELNSYNYF